MVPGEADRNAIGMERNSVIRTYAIHASSVVHVLCSTVASLFCCPTALHLSCLIQTLSHHTSYYPHARSPFSPRLITPVPPNTSSVHEMVSKFQTGSPRTSLVIPFSPFALRRSSFRFRLSNLAAFRWRLSSGVSV